MLPLGNIGNDFVILFRLAMAQEGNSLTFMTRVIMYIFGVWNLGKTNIFGVWDFEDWKKYLGSRIDDKLTYLGSEILRAKR